MPHFRFLPAFVLVPAFLFAQHNAGSSNASSSTAASSAAASSASHSASTSTSSSSATHSSATTSSSGASMSSHSAPGASAHNAVSESHASLPSKSSTSNRVEDTSANKERSRRTTPKIDSMVPKKTADIEKEKDVGTATAKPPEQHRRWIFWRHPSAPKDANLRKKPCLKEPCPVCPPGETRQNGRCLPPVVAETHFCAADERWDGLRCSQIVETCPIGQIREGATCRTDCTSQTSGAPHWITMLRNARQDRDQACRQSPTSQECREAEAAYNLRLHEYRSFLGGLPVECRAGLPDPAGVI